MDERVAGRPRARPPPVRPRPSSAASRTSSRAASSNGSRSRSRSSAIRRSCVLDEPTTGLDVVTQARILAELGRLQRESSIALVYVSHDLAVVSSIADRVAVMYAGRIVEEGPTQRDRRRAAPPVLRRPDLERARPRRAAAPGRDPGRRCRRRRSPAGCAFAPRCELRIPACEEEMPELVAVDDASPRALPALEVDRAARDRTATRRGVAQRGIPAPERRGPPRDPPHGPGRGGGRRRRQLHRGVRRVRGARGRVGQRQDDDRAVHRRPARPEVGPDLVAGEPLAGFAGDRTREQRRAVQIVFQNPYDSLNPRRSVEDAIGWPVRALRGLECATGTGRGGETARAGPPARRVRPALSGRALRRRAAARSRSRAPSRRRRSCSSATRSPRRSTSRFKPRCSTCSPSSAASCSCRCSSSATIWASSQASPTASWSSRTGSSARREPCSRCFRRHRAPTPRDSSPRLPRSPRRPPI